MILEGPLNGITVLDLTRVLAGPYCTMILSDLGARVIKVEAPMRGDDSRHIGPFSEGRSGYFSSLNRGKESIALNLKAADDRRIFEALLDHADVLVENFRPGAMEKLGYGYETLAQKHPGLVYAAASGFGQTGPYRQKPAYDMVVQGMGGVMSITGHPGGPPTRVGTSVGDLTAGLFTAIGVTAALHDRNRTGKGQMVDVAMLDCQIAILENAIARYFWTGEIPGPLGARHPSITPFQAYETSDGHIIIAAGNDSLFQRLTDALGAKAVAADPRFANNGTRTEHVDALKSALEPILRTQTTVHWQSVLDQAGIPNGPINNVHQALNDPQVKARNMVVSAPDAVLGSVNMAGNPIKLSAYADPATRGPVPELDEHRSVILATLDLEAANDG